MTGPPLEQLCHAAAHDWNSLQNVGELTQLCKWLERRPGPFHYAIEVGVMHAGTARLWHELGAFVVGVDLGINCRGCDLRRAHDGCPHARMRSAGVLIEGDSQLEETRDRVVKLLDGPADFLHIDGDHSREAAARDFELYGPLVRAGGAVAFHDCRYGDVHGDYGVVALWDEELSKLPGAFLIHEPGGFGIGVVPC